MDFGNMTRSLKIKLRFVAGVVVLGLVFPGIALLPGRIEGVYRAEALAGSTCMDCKSYFEIREGRGVYHDLDDGASEPMSWLFLDYEAEPSGVVAMRIHSRKEGEIEPVITRAYPHLLVTEFVSEERHTSTWIWKVPTFLGLRKKFAAARIRDLIIEPDSLTDFFCDSSFKVIETRVRPRVSKPTH